MTNRIQKIQSRLSWMSALVLGSVGMSFAPPAVTSGVTLTLDPVQTSYAANQEVGFIVKGQPNTFTILGADPDPGPTVFPYGVVNLGFSSEMLRFSGLTDENGCFSIYCVVGCDHPFFNRTIYLQAVQFPKGAQPCISNPATVLWEDLRGVCAQTNLCPGSGFKPQVLTMKYTGDDCSATNHSQAAGKVFCSGDPGFAPLVHIISHDPANKYIWFQGDVALNANFDIDATSAGRVQLQGDTIVDIFDVNNGALLQTVQFHTSCSQPLIPGDQYGGVELVSAVLVQKNIK